MPIEHHSPFTPANDGVWTDDVGVITGPLELRTECADDGAVTLRVRYEGADEWYTVRGGTGHLADPADAQVLHQIVLGILHRPEG